MTRLRAPHSQLGLTLTEVMMVVFIIGLTSSLVVLTLPARPSVELRTADAFVEATRRAQDQAILTGQPIGLIVEAESYRFASWYSGDWKPLPGGSETLDRAISLSKQDTPEGTFPDGWPDVIFDPTGVVQPARFTLQSRSENIDLILDESGHVRIEQK